MTTRPSPIELEDGVRHLIDDPDVVLRIDLHLLGEEERIDPLTDLTDVLARLVEAEHTGAAVRERTRRPERERRVTGPRVDEYVALRVGRDARDLAEVEVARQLERLNLRVVGKLRNDQLRRERRNRERKKTDEQLNGALHDGLLISQPSSWLDRGGRLQHQLLHAPRFDFGNDDLVGIAAVHHVYHLEATKLLSSVAELPDDRSVQLHLVDLARDVPRSRRVAIRVGIRAEQILVRAG
jgi:hypothetical protein